MYHIKQAFKSRTLLLIILGLMLTSMIFGAIRISTIAQSDSKGRLVISVKEGPEWLHAFRVMMVAKVKNPPQMAFWLEDTTGNFVATIYVTHRTAIQDWRAAPFQKKETIRRPSSLPIWIHKHQTGGVQAQTVCASCHDWHKGPKKPDIDNDPIAAITGATPKASFVKEWRIPAELKAGAFIVHAEINHSKDFNASFPEPAKETDPNYSGGSWGSGQPSLLWSGRIKIGEQPTSGKLKLVGHGQPAGKDGSVTSDLSSLSSALNIVQSIRMSYVPEPLR